MHPQLLLPLLLTTPTSAHCTLPLLQSIVSTYLTSQFTGSPTPLTPYLSNSTPPTYTENALPLPFSRSILTTPLPITHNRSIYDLPSCASFTELVSANASTPHVIGTQIRVEDHKVVAIESLVTKAGDWLFNATGYQYWTSREAWGEIPLAARDTRETIRAAADAYLDVFNNPNVTVPWGTPCVRLEGGLYGDPGVNGSCAGGVPSGVPLTRRRYVVDEGVGAVDVLLDFGKSGWPDSHLFRVEKGRLRYVHTMTHCGVKNCGL